MSAIDADPTPVCDRLRRDRVGRPRRGISPTERFEILVDFANRKPVMLETGPDTAMGIFGAVSEAGTAEFVPIMRFEPTARAAIAKEIPARLVGPATADSNGAIHHREY